MRVLFSFLLIVCVSMSATIEQTVFTRVPTVLDAAVVARTLVHRESLGALGSIDKLGFPVGFSEYYVEENGDPVLILLRISSSHRNIKANNKVSFSLRTGDHQPNDKVDLEYPGSVKNSVAGSPRILFKGSVKALDSVSKDVELRFLERHPDAKYWLPGTKKTPHSGYWAKVQIELIYFIGGFGDRAFIGEIPVDLYHSVEPL